MRARWIALVTLPLFAIEGGCLETSSDNCELSNTCRADGDGGQAGTGGTGGSDSSCDPHMTNEIAASCGVYVSSSLGSDTGDGTRDNPFATLTAAIEQSEAAKIYACGEIFDEGMVVGDDVTVYGGLDCAAGWAPGDVPTLVQPTTAGVVPLIINGGSVTLWDAELLAPPGDDNAKSSIAVIVRDGTADFDRVRVVASDAANGAAGAIHTDPATAGGDGGPGNGGGCNGTVPGQGAGGLNGSCATRGGIGGSGGRDDGAAATDGEGGLPVSAGTGLGGVPTGDFDKCSVIASQAGRSGVNGGHGVGATGLGELSLSGYTGADGGPGNPGTDGQGGGGGGGHRNPSCFPILGWGGAGSGGGAGGCGGLPGSGGAAGGSSIAIVAIESVLLFGDDVAVATGQGGRGGDGSAGQVGGLGGDGGYNTSQFAQYRGCPGGDGGNGGSGGTGGGGRGGHSIGIAYVGFDMLPEVTPTLGTAGTGGAAPNAGADGVAVATLEFPSSS